MCSFCRQAQFKQHCRLDDQRVDWLEAACCNRDDSLWYSVQSDGGVQRGVGPRLATALEASQVCVSCSAQDGIRFRDKVTNVDLSWQSKCANRSIFREQLSCYQTNPFILLFTYEQSKKDKKNRLKEIYIDKNYLLIPCPTLHFGWKVSIDQSLRK